MKKIIASISLLSYFVVTCGLVFNYHYCMNRLDSTQLFGAKTKVCGKCGMDTHEPNGCCHDEIKLIKLQQDQNKTTIASYAFTAPEAVNAIPPDFIVASSYNVDATCHQHNNSPPGLNRQDIYLQNCVFRI